MHLAAERQEVGQQRLARRRVGAVVGDAYRHARIVRLDAGDQPLHLVRSQEGLDEDFERIGRSVRAHTWPAPKSPTPAAWPSHAAESARATGRKWSL